MRNSTSNSERRNAPRPNAQRPAAPQSSGQRKPAPHPNAQRPAAPQGSGQRKPAPRPNAQRSAAPQSSSRRSGTRGQAPERIEKKPVKTKSEKIITKKKKKVKDPNHIGIFSLEGRVDIPMLIITLVLLAIGIIMMFSASHYYSYRDNEGDSYFFVRKQMFAAALGLGGMMFVSLIDYRYLYKESKRFHITVAHLFLVLCIGINFLCPLIGIEAQGGQKRWIQAPIVGQFQPSDFLKLGLIIYLAYYISKNSEKLRTLYGGIVKPLLVMAPVVLSVMVQKHLSCTVILFLIFAVMLFVGGVNIKEALPLAVIVILAGVFMISVLKVGYFQERIDYMDPLSDPEWRSYQNYQSALAIGSGGVWGKGFGNSTQKYGGLPEAHNDFVFSILVEEFGLVGGIFVIILFIVFVMRGLYIARKSEDKFGCLVATGITFQIGVQALLNIGVTVCCIPNTGISLPFFSYGGTALVLQLLEMGLLLSISKRARVR